MSGPWPSDGSWSDFAGRPVPPASERPSDAKTTAELPTVVGPGAGRPSPDADPARPPALIGRFTVSLAGLLVAGCLVLGIGLVVLMLVVPGTGGSDYDYATGPGWPRTFAHLAVGVLGEAGVQWGRRRSWALRLTVSGVIVVAVLVIFALSWWR